MYPNESPRSFVNNFTWEKPRSANATPATHCAQTYVQSTDTSIHLRGQIFLQVDAGIGQGYGPIPEREGPRKF